MAVTYHYVKSLFYWKGLKKDIAQFVSSCDVCQRHKHELLPSPGLLSHVAIPSSAWSQISMDFIERLPKSRSLNVILVVVDRYTKYAHFIPLYHPFTAHSVAQLFLDNIYKLHGLPTHNF
ncbi:hypothetical protein LIER_19596 [Lithospermum erythrorhizon]|uniref:Integrase zinc-binding domain-containing protein n=1 Tax=Lithospermum erythrorhizon TaxID=34254 RepID=A0AAV3QM40_LITER